MKTIRFIPDFFPICIFFSLLISLSWNCKDREDSLILQGNEIVKKIEEYRRANSYLPNSLSDIGIAIRSESDPPIYYERMGSAHYVLWFGTSLGESMKYYSNSKKWENFYREIK